MTLSKCCDHIHSSKKGFKYSHKAWNDNDTYQSYKVIYGM